MRILFVDDDASRYHALLRMLWSARVGADVTHRASAEQVTDTDLLEAEVVMLDHDLCNAHYIPEARFRCDRVDTDGRCLHGTGADVARRIADLPLQAHQGFIVHSLNVEGSANIIRILAGSRRRCLSRCYDRWGRFIGPEFVRWLGLPQRVA